MDQGLRGVSQGSSGSSGAVVVDLPGEDRLEADDGQDDAAEEGGNSREVHGQWLDGAGRGLRGCPAGDEGLDVARLARPVFQRFRLPLGDALGRHVDELAWLGFVYPLPLPDERQLGFGARAVGGCAVGLSCAKPT